MKQLQTLLSVSDPWKLATQSVDQQYQQPQELVGNAETQDVPLSCSLGNRIVTRSSGGACALWLEEQLL